MTVSATAPDTTESAPEARAGSALVRATFPYAKEDLGRTWQLFATTMLVFAGFEVLAASPLPWFVRLIGSIGAALTWVRVFIFFHDHLHGAIWRKSAAGRWVMNLVGILTLSPSPVWRETHDYHHRNNAKIVGAAIGSFPVATVRMWRRMTKGQRLAYRFIRSPLNMLMAYVTMFMIGMCIQPFLRNPSMHWQGPFALALHAGLVAGLWWFFGPLMPLFVLVIPLAIACTSGAFLFYVQHNFPECQLADRAGWNYHAAALSSSSMMDMSGIMHWFTGNIGYHHVHHLNHKVPFYNLPVAMAEVPELQAPGRTSWAPADVKACLDLALWDNRSQSWITWANVP